MSFEPVGLAGGEDWLLRPVMRSLVRFESLLDGSVDLSHVALLNDALDVQDENETRAREAMRQK